MSKKKSAMKRAYAKKSVLYSSTGAISGSGKRPGSGSGGPGAKKSKKAFW